MFALPPRVGALRLALLCVALRCGFPSSDASAAELPTANDARLIPVFQANRVWNGVATTRDGRVFVCYPGADGPGVQAEEILPDGTRRPYPDQTWNDWKPGQDPTRAFVCVNALRHGSRSAGWTTRPSRPPRSPGTSRPGGIHRPPAAPPSTRRATST